MKCCVAVSQSSGDGVLPHSFWMRLQDLERARMILVLVNVFLTGKACVYVVHVYLQRVRMR